MIIEYSIIFTPIFLSVLYIAYVLKYLRNIKDKDKDVILVSNKITKGVRFYLKKQYKNVMYFVILTFVLIYVYIDFKTSAGFLIGAIFSILAGIVSSMISSWASSKTVAGSRRDKKSAFNISFKSGTINGVFIVSSSLLIVSLIYFIFEDMSMLIGLGLGAGIVSIFTRIGGGIFTKVSDIGADIILKKSKTENENSLSIPDNVGDNVGDCSGISSDVLETYVTTLSLSIFLGASLVGTFNAAVFPLILGGVSLLSSLVAIFFTKINGCNSAMKAFYKGFVVSIFVSVIGYYFASKMFFGVGSISIFMSSITGLLLGWFVVAISDYYTSKDYEPVQSLSESVKLGQVQNLIKSFSINKGAVILPVIVASFAIMASYSFSGLYGIAISAMSMLSVIGLVLSMDTFGPIVDNASGISEMTKQPKEIIEINNQLDYVGNTAKAVTKNYVVVSTILSSIMFISIYISNSGIDNKILDLNSYKIVISVLLGVATAYLLTSMILKTVYKIISSIIKKFENYYNEPLESTIQYLTNKSVSAMFLPALIPLALVIGIGFLFGVKILGGFLIGFTISGVIMAISMVTGGATADNVQKYVKEAEGSKEDRIIAVDADMIHDPYKDVVGPTINPLIRTMSMLALLIVKFLK